MDVRAGQWKPSALKWGSRFASGPKYTCLPPLSSSIESPSSNSNSDGWWMVHSTGVLVARAYLRMDVMMENADAESRPLVGWQFAAKRARA